MHRQRHGNDAEVRHGNAKEVHFLAMFLTDVVEEMKAGTANVFRSEREDGDEWVVEGSSPNYNVTVDMRERSGNAVTEKEVDYGAVRIKVEPPSEDEQSQNHDLAVLMDEDAFNNAKEYRSIKVEEFEDITENWEDCCFAQTDLVRNESERDRFYDETRRLKKFSAHPVLLLDECYVRLQRIDFSTSNRVVKIEPDDSVPKNLEVLKSSYEDEANFDASIKLETCLENGLEEEFYECVHCEKRFKFASKLKSHERQHTGKRPYRCSYCGLKFISPHHLITHERRYHDKEKPLQCSHCGKKYSTKSELIIHERQHTGEKPFKCSRCEKKYRRKSSLRVHERHHHTKGKGKSHPCAYCGKKFFTTSDMKVHERYHTDERRFQCPHCPKKFFKSEHLKVHRRYHTGERPYACSDCGVKFIKSWNLKSHQKLHQKLPHLK